MKNKITFLLLLFIVKFGSAQGSYNEDYANFGKKTYNENEFFQVRLKRKNMRVRAKYFADEIDSLSVGERYAQWSKNKNIICYSSGAYMSDLDAQNASLVGLTIDFGKVVNKTFKRGSLDALVVLHTNGTIEIVNLKDGTISLSGSGETKSFNMSSDLGVEKLVDWAKTEKLTLFQTHLLVYNNESKVASNSSQDVRERRFLVVATNSKGEEEHYIIHNPAASSLKEGSNAVLNYLKNKSFSVKALINLDTGAQDVFKFYNYDGTESSKLVGATSIENARNLIVYYYE